MNDAPSRKLRFSKPEKIWQWLMLFTPGLLITVVATVTRVSAQGSDRGLAAMASGLITGPIGAVLCLGFGFWLARKSDGIRKKILGAVLFGLALAAVNLAIGFPGCMLVSSR
jgi:hypothetical protein